LPCAVPSPTPSKVGRIYLTCIIAIRSMYYHHPARDPHIVFTGAGDLPIQR
jgi:hypothetical protein